jgi:hypothetical protein
MPIDEQRLLEEVDFWLRLNNDYLLRHGTAPSRRMQEALFHALDRLRQLREMQDQDEPANPEAQATPVEAMRRAN